MLDDFDEIVDRVEWDFDIEDVVDVTKLSTLQLVELKESIETSLFERMAALNPHDQESRDLHSLRNAVQVELSTRIGRMI